VGRLRQVVPSSGSTTVAVDSPWLSAAGGRRIPMQILDAKLLRNTARYILTSYLVHKAIKLNYLRNQRFHHPTYSLLQPMCYSFYNVHYIHAGMVHSLFSCSELSFLAMPKGPALGLALYKIKIARPSPRFLLALVSVAPTLHCSLCAEQILQSALLITGVSQFPLHNIIDAILLVLV
jgi:hypothetical protein